MTDAGKRRVGPIGVQPGRFIPISDNPSCAERGAQASELPGSCPDDRRDRRTAATAGFAAVYGYPLDLKDC
jgi:hypothetical protein